MAAHLRDIIRARCAHPLCNAYATKELYNTWNAPLGSYCTRHAKQALAEFVKRNPEQGGWVE